MIICLPDHDNWRDLDEELIDKVKATKRGARLYDLWFERMNHGHMKRMPGIYNWVAAQLETELSDAADDLREEHTDEYELRGLKRSDF